MTKPTMRRGDLKAYRARLEEIRDSFPDHRRLVEDDLLWRGAWEGLLLAEKVQSYEDYHTKAMVGLDEKPVPCAEADIARLELFDQLRRFQLPKNRK